MRSSVPASFSQVLTFSAELRNLHLTLVFTGIAFCEPRVIPTQTKEFAGHWAALRQARGIPFRLAELLF
jgi:hypothetical protein